MKHLLTNSTKVIALTCLFLMLIIYKNNNSRTTRMNSKFEQMPSNPAWKRSAIIELEKLDQAAASAEAMFDLSKFYVFVAFDPKDDADVPTDVPNQVDFGKSEYSGPNSHAMKGKWFPYRVYIVPRTDLKEALRRFEVAFYAISDADDYSTRIMNVIRKIEAINDTRIVELGRSDVLIKFGSPITMNECLRIQDVFVPPGHPELIETVGMDGYFNDWDPESGQPCPIAETVFTDQEIHLWWD